MNTSTPLHTETFLSKEKTFVFQVFNEDDLSWQQHHAIHRILNESYAHRTRSFFAKTHGHREPLQRILCTLDDELVGHTAIFEDYVLENLKIGGIGMTCSQKPMDALGYELRKRAIALCRARHCTFATGRVKNNARTKQYLNPLALDFLDMPLVGTTTQSHDWETLAIYSTGTDPAQVNPILERFKAIGAVKISGEIF